MFVMTAIAVNAQTQTLSGTVTDADGEPMIGANVIVVGTGQGVATDLEGKYTLKNIPSGAKIRYSYIGYTAQELSPAGKTEINVVLEPEASMLDEVVAIGYARVRRRDLTASTASVGGKELASVPVSTAAQALAGKAAGVNIVAQSGAPGADINITVRGGTTLTQGAEPLYIVDGFQMEDGLRNVDINDIETIDVMKDASATAIYGSAGANGVILITTKSGEKGKTSINYNGYVSFTRLGKKIDVLNPEEYVKYQYEFNQLRGNIDSWTKLFGGNINDPDFYTGAYSRIEQEYRNREGIDWQDEVFGNTGVTHNHNVSINGGTDKTNFMVSYNYIGEEGIMKKHNYEKNSVRAKIRHEMFDILRFDFAASFQNTKTEGGGSLGGKLKQTILQPVTGGNLWTNDELLHTDLTDFFAEMPGSSNYDANNPILNNNAITNEKHHRMASVNAGLEIDIIKGLTFRTAGSYTWQQIRSDYWDDGSTKQAMMNLSPYGYGSRDNSERSNWQITNTLNYNFDINRKHEFTVLIGQETSYWSTLKLENEWREFPDGNFGLNDVNMGKPYSWKSGESRVGLVSVFGRVSYNYEGRYLVNATLRADGSSKFARGNKWDWFPSVSAAWRISQEKFMEPARGWLDNLKLRLGYGVAGNNKIDNNMYATDYGSGHYASNGNDFITFVPGTVLGNAALVWEKTKTYNAAIDFSVLNSRINLSVDWYNNQSDNLLIKNKIPSSTGYSEQFQNLGSIRNRGVEIVLNTVNITN
ncbi:MAG: SusC/RagA family TonB-linked outer membrane protein, partial [Duncaniella sp.]|nr:SusC/RagA family TonB-linked outer membrane protein [Duncaniella sp.]